MCKTAACIFTITRENCIFQVTHKGLWAVPFARYNYLRYPPYCLGPCYTMGLETAKTIFSQSQHTHCDLSVDDVMISGVLRIKVSGLNYF